MISEHSEQVLLINWVRAQQKKDPRLASLFAVPNGGSRNPQTARKLKAEGVLAGVPDLFLPVPVEGYHGLFVEMKRADGGTISKAQTGFIAMMIAHGYEVRVCAGHKAAITVIEEYLSL